MASFHVTAVSAQCSALHGFDSAVSWICFLAVCDGNVSILSKFFHRPLDPSF